MVSIHSSFRVKCALGLLALLLLPRALHAQQPESSLDFTSLRSLAVSRLTLPIPALFSIAGLPQQAHTAKSTKKRAARSMRQPKLDPSMVGYIDDASVESEVRIRFDAGFNDPRPDRAEYFYAGHSAPVPSTASIQTTLNFQQLYLNAEYAPVKSFSGFVMIPYRWIQPFFLPSTTRTPDLFSGSGISDVQAGLKYAAIASAARKLTLQLTASFPSGDGVNGFGTNHYSLEPIGLLYQKISGRTSVEAEFGDSHPIGGTIYRATPTSTPQNFAADVLMYGIGPSYLLVNRDNYRLAPVLELVAWHVFGGLQTAVNNQVQSAAGINVFNIKLGARLNLSDGGSFYAGYGRALTSDIWYRNLFRIEYRRSF